MDAFNFFYYYRLCHGNDISIFCLHDLIFDILNDIFVAIYLLDKVLYDILQRLTVLVQLNIQILSDKSGL